MKVIPSVPNVEKITEPFIDKLSTMGDKLDALDELAAIRGLLERLLELEEAKTNE